MKCSVCGYHLLFTCPECDGSEELNVTITRNEYDSLLEYKSMYEGLCK